MLREEVRQKTDLGVVAAGYMSAGELLPDDIIIKIMPPAPEPARRHQRLDP